MNIVYSQPIAVSAGADQTIPKNSTTTLTGSASGGSGAYTFSWQPANLLVGSMTDHPETIPLDNDVTFIMTVTDVITGCQYTDTVQVLMDAGIQVIAALNNYDTTGVNIPIDVNVLDNDAYTKNLPVTVTLCGGPEHGTASVFSDNQIRYTPNRDFSGIDSLCYIVCYDEYPEICDTAIVYIYISREFVVDWLIIPNVITPNGDGVNDEWIIDGIERFPDNTIKIFNRWGDKVKTFESYNNTTRVWRGENEQNQPLPDGTYYYVLTIKDGGTRTGWILIRGSSR
jgi:gliding motility-associated-like protein